MTTKKVIQKSISMALENLKQQNTVAMVSMLKEVEVVTAWVFESLLSFISCSMPESNSLVWSIVSNLMRSKRVTYEGEETNQNEIVKVAAMLQSIVGLTTTKANELKLSIF